MYLLRTVWGVHGPHGQPHDGNRLESDEADEGEIDELQQYKQSVAASVHYNNHI